VTRRRLAQGLALVRDWVAPGDAIAQWTHFVTSVCNARCAHCFYPINAGKRELTLEEIGRLLTTLPPIRLLLIGGGEPFLRRDLPAIIRLYHERTGFFTCSVPTNGFSASEISRMTEEICAISPELSFGVTVSLDGFREFHDRVRRLPGLYDRATETLEALLALSRRLPNLTVGVTTVFMRDNQGEIEAFGEHVWRRYRPNQHSINWIRGDAFDPSLKEGLDLDLYEKVCAQTDARYTGADIATGWRGARARARHLINRRRSEYIARQARGGPFEGFCLAGDREFILTEDGTVYGCELIDRPLGNVRDTGYDFGPIRESQAAREFLERKKERLCRCTHECNARTMVLFDRANALPVLAAMAGIQRRPPPPV
jgi:radical SAM protein with 4Fe4S-binding SPASM domain